MDRRIAMWSARHPIASFLMRAFQNRADTQVIDEPFYAHFLKQTGYDHPGRAAVLNGQPSDIFRIEAALSAPLEPGKDIFYQKHISNHIYAGMDQSWLDGMTNAFLICEPLSCVVPHAETVGDVTLADLGLQQQLALFEYLTDRQGEAPVVVDRCDIMRQPEATLRKLCNALEISFDSSMLSWPAGPRESDGPWAPYQYQRIEASTGFDRPDVPEVKLNDQLLYLADLAMPLYERLARHRI